MILLIRHGATAGNLARQYLGQTDEGLCEVGVGQAEALREALEAAGASTRPTRVFVSPMQRCRETAGVVFPGLEPVAVDGLREMDFGMLEGRTHAELEDDPRYRAWVASEGRMAIPGGESREVFDARCVGAFRALGLGPDDDAAIVCHGGTVMAILSALGESGRGYYDYRLGNAEAYVCEVGEDGRLRVLRRVTTPQCHSERSASAVEG